MSNSPFDPKTMADRIHRAFLGPPGVQEAEEALDERLREECGGRNPKLWAEVQVPGAVQALFQLLVEKEVLSETDEVRWLELCQECAEVGYDMMLEKTKRYMVDAGMDPEDVEEALK